MYSLGIVIIKIMCSVDCYVQVVNELLRLDEQELNNKYKIGVMYCKPGQTTEEEMYNNGELQGQWVCTMEPRNVDAFDLHVLVQIRVPRLNHVGLSL